MSDESSEGLQQSRSERTAWQTAGRMLAFSPAGDRPFVRRPAVLAALLLAMGTGLDRWLTIPWPVWMTGGLLAVLAAALLIRRDGRRTPGGGPADQNLAALATWPVLVAMLSVGGLRHHLVWSSRDSQNISAWATEEPRLVRLVGVIDDSVEILPAPFGPTIPSWMELDRSVCRVRCERIQDRDDWKAVSGHCRLVVSGHLVHVGMGDRVEIVGQLLRPSAPKNPGAVRFGDQLRAQGADCLLRVNHPLAVSQQGTQSGPVWTLSRLRESVRNRSQNLMAAHLRPASRALAASLLLGDRTRVSEEMRQQFVQTGTMHLLAISGLHVGILLGLMLSVCRLLNLNTRWTVLLLITGLLCYAGLTNHRPPVLRATILASIGLIGGLSGRRVDGINLLAVSAMILLLWRPMDLFDVGAQLSFLAVAAILSAGVVTGRVQRYLISGPSWQEESVQATLWQQGAWGLLQLFIISLNVWLIALPLSLSVFHLAAPVGTVLNVLLIPWTGVVLTLGYLFLIPGLLFPGLAGIVAVPFEWSLELFQAVTAWGQSAAWGHFSTAGPSLWWLIGFYFLLSGVWRLWGTRRQGDLAFRGLCLWVVVGLGAGLLPARDRNLRCTFLSVGHGLATVIELPNGRTLLYDAGTIGDGRRASRAVENLLWSRGRRSLDAVIVSHADHDHYSGLFQLIETVPIGSLLVSQRFLHPEQRQTQELCELAAQWGTVVKIVQAGDRLDCGDPGVGLEIWHPTGGFRGETDNANSIVLGIEFAGRRILLTGDLERSGLDCLLSMPTEPWDLLLAPHHGSRSANIAALYEWARPKHVVVSSSHAESIEALRPQVGEAVLLCTQTSGAILFEIDSAGGMRLQEYLVDPW